MIQSIRQSYDFKKFLKKAGGSGEVVPNPQQPAEYFLDSVKIGSDAYVVKQVPRDGQENQMLVKRGAAETGLQFVNTDSVIVDVSSVAPKYDETKNQTSVSGNAYNKDDLVTYQNKLYKANTALKSRAGVFLSTGWNKILDWDEYSTYTEGMERVYEGAVYECVVATATVGTFVSEEWNDVSASYSNYSETAVYTPNVSKVKYESDFYIANSQYMGTGGVGPFTAIYWDQTTAEEEINNSKFNENVVADPYNPEKNPSDHIAYRMGDFVMYNNELYKANQTISTKAGAFNSDMWDMATTYDAQETYALGDITLYNGDLYMCTSESGATGPWDATKWEIQYPSSYNQAASYYTPGTVVEYNGDYYKANATYENSPVGSFDVLKWTKTNVASNLGAPFKTFSLIKSSSSATTDANGFLKFTVTASGGSVIPVGLSTGDSQPNTGAFFELVKSSYAGEANKIIVKVTDNTGAAMTNATLTAYMTGLLSVVYMGTGTISAVSI